VKTRKGDYEPALADYARALELEPKNALIYHYRGDANLAHGDFDGAIADYDRAIELNPKIALTFRQRSIAKEKKATTTVLWPTSDTHGTSRTPKLV
jgi:tetratricopeptide (TPR) repeat protein